MFSEYFNIDQILIFLIMNFKQRPFLFVVLLNFITFTWTYRNIELHFFIIFDLDHYKIIVFILCFSRIWIFNFHCWQAFNFAFLK